jgi:Tol biopolymer transport system component
MLLAQERLTPEKLWQLGRVSAPLVSPDAQKVLYEVRRYDLAGNNSKNYIHIVSVNGGTPQVISTAEQNAYSAKWRPDGKKITFLSAQSGKPQVYEMNPDGSDVQQVTNAEQGINYYKYAPTLDRIAYAADVKLDQRMNEVYSDLPQSTARLIDGLMFRHWDSWHDYAYSHLFVVNYNNGKTEGNAIDIMDDERYDAPLRPHGGDEQFNWSPDGKRLAYTCRKLQGTLEALSTNSDIYLYDVSSGKTV